MVRKCAINITTAADGSASGNTPVLTGYVRAISYVPHGATPLDTNADVVFTAHASGAPILTQANIGTASRTWHPRTPTHASADGSAALYAAAGQAVNTEIPVCDECISLVVANGGNALSGTFHLYIDGM